MLHQFDSLTSGKPIGRRPTDDELNELLVALPTLADTEDKIPAVRLDEYIISTINCYIRNKTHIHFGGMPYFYGSKGRRKLQSKITYPDLKVKPDQFSIEQIDDCDYINLMKPSLFKTFPYAKELIMMTTPPSGYAHTYVWPFSMSSLLTLIRKTGLLKITIKGWINQRIKNGYWLEQVWDDKSEELEREYGKSGYKITWKPSDPNTRTGTKVMKELIIEKIKSLTKKVR